MNNIQKTIKKAKEQDFSSLSVVGRNLIGVSFIVFGINYIVEPQMVSYYVVPFFIIFKIIIGLVFMFGGALLILQKHVYEAAIYMSWFIAFVYLFTYSSFSITAIFYNISLIGALLLVADGHDKNDKGIVQLVKGIFK